MRSKLVVCLGLVPAIAAALAVAAQADTGGASPEAGALRWFTAERTNAHHVVLRWRTAGDWQLVGFDIYRQREGSSVRINRSPVMAWHHAGGAVYVFKDRTAREGSLRYRVQAIETNGTRIWLGAASVT